MMIAVQLGILLVLLFLIYLLVQKLKQEKYKQVFPLISIDKLSIHDRLLIDQLLHQQIMVQKEIYSDLCYKYIRGIYPLIQEVPCDLEERLGLIKSNMELFQIIKRKILSHRSLSPSELTVLHHLMNDDDSPKDYGQL